MNKTLSSFYVNIYQNLVSFKYAKILFGFIVIVATVRLLYYTNHYSVNILYWDEWDFYDAFFEDQSLIEIFNFQFGPHKQGLAFILTKFIDHYSDWNTRYISFTSSLFLIATAATYLILKQKTIGKIQFFDIVIPLIVLTPAQFSLFSGVPNLSHGPMPVFLISLYCLTLLNSKSWLRNTLLIILTFNLLYSGFGLVIGFITPLLFLTDSLFFTKQKNKKETLLSLLFLVVSLACIFLFLHDYKHHPNSDIHLLGFTELWKYFYFVAISYLNFFFSSIQFGFLGFGILIPIFYVLTKQFITLYKNFHAWEFL